MQFEQPSDDAEIFRNYYGVEQHPVTEEELQMHITAGHLAEFDTFEQLSEFVNATPEEPAILSKLGLIIKMKNGVEKARMILDTKESGVGKRTGKHQRVILPRLFDAILRMLFLMDVGAMSKTTSVIKQPSNRHRHFSDNEEQEQYDGN